MKTPLVSLLSPALAASLMIVSPLAADVAVELPEPEAVEVISTSFAEGVPGGVIVQVFDFSAEVIEIDYEARTAVVTGPDGRPYELKAGPDAHHFEQVEVGDMVDFTVARELTIAMAEEGQEAKEATVGVMARSPEGEEPKTLMAMSSQIIGTVTEINLERHSATLTFEDGTTETFDVRPDIDLNKHSVGEKVVFTVTDSIVAGLTKK